MGKKIRIKEMSIPPEILEDIKSILDNNNIKFEEAPPELVRKIEAEVIEFHKTLEQVMTVSTLPHAMYEKYRLSGKTVGEVYKEITSNN